MSLLTDSHIRPIAVDAAPTGPSAAAGADAPATATARVCAVIVTWNRKSFVTSVLQALARQTYPTSLLDVVVVDNAGTDGTLDHLAQTFRPERIVDNPTDAAHRPSFQAPRAIGSPPPETNGRASHVPHAPGPGSAATCAEHAAPPSNTLGLASLTIVRNTNNMGGCGGFNTGFAYVEHALGRTTQGGPDFVWLVDDDVDLPPDALANLVRVMESDPHIGLVGSRTCDISDRSRTIETTIYFNADAGSMQDDAPSGHRRHDVHQRWLAKVGGPRGQGDRTLSDAGTPVGYRGTMDVDVVSACSMLARWSAVLGETNPGGKPGVGFWDHRYFIYCDDADWCLRFAKQGWRVVLNLDAVVYHTPWNLKLTPARIYYANRNRLWMIQKTLPEPQLRAVTEKVMRTFLFDALHAALHRRLFHANIILQTGLDAASNVGGKTGSDGPPGVPLQQALEQAGAARPDGRVAVLCPNAAALKWFTEFQARVAAGAPAGPTLIPVVRNDVPNPPPGAIIYGRHLGSRLKKQWHILSKRPRAVVVLDQVNDFPVLLSAPWTLHVDTKKPDLAQVERDGWAPRIGFLFKWLRARATLLRYARSVRPYVSETRYG